MHAPREPHACPVCGSGEVARLAHRASVPVHHNVLYRSADEARAATRGELDLRACVACAFVFNAAFDAALLEYGDAYVNAQGASPTFSTHAAGLVADVAACPEARDGRILEIGCGDGSFLRALLSTPGVDAEGLGLDPAYVGPAEMLDGRLRFASREFEPGDDAQADVVILRHVVEHLADPVQLLRETGPARLFVETPCVEWILRTRAPWDFFYEHCSLFSAASLAAALARAGHAGATVERTFGEQYLWAESPAPGEADAPEAQGFEDAVRAYDDRDAVDRLVALVRSLAVRGPTLVWGAGAKGATFCDLVDPRRELLAAVVDVNPAKQGRHVAGSGHAVVSPAHALDRDVAVVLVLNPNYTAEISAQLDAMGSAADVVDLTLEVQQCA